MKKITRRFLGFAALCVLAAAQSGCTMFHASSPTLTVTRVSVLQDFSTKKISCTLGTNGVPTFSVTGMGDEVSPQTSAIVGAAVEAAVKGAKP